MKLSAKGISCKTAEFYVIIFCEQVEEIQTGKGGRVHVTCRVVLETFRTNRFS